MVAFVGLGTVVGFVTGIDVPVVAGVVAAVLEEVTELGVVTVVDVDDVSADDGGAMVEVVDGLVVTPPGMAVAVGAGARMVVVGAAVVDSTTAVVDDSPTELVVGSED